MPTGGRHLFLSNRPKTSRFYNFKTAFLLIYFSEIVVLKFLLYSAGEIFICLIKTFRILSDEPSPHKAAISFKEIYVSTKYLQAVSTLSLSIYFAGVIPVSLANTLAKFLGLIDIFKDKSSTVIVSLKFSCIQSQIF